MFVWVWDVWVVCVTDFPFSPHPSLLFACSVLARRPPCFLKFQRRWRRKLEEREKGGRCFWAIFTYLPQDNLSLTGMCVDVGSMCLEFLHTLMGGGGQPKNLLTMERFFLLLLSPWGMGEEGKWEPGSRTTKGGQFGEGVRLRNRSVTLGVF